ncbi:MAG: nucleoside deaminase, partial [Kiritimatiellae bacterium]|nr:nucleoside deaminase [Kiritimatiellia bacterium]
MENDEKFMREALAEARIAADEGEVPVGAVVVARGRVIARGHNMTERLADPTAHAEMIALTAATEALGGKYLSDCALYVTLEPCPMCAGAIVQSRIPRVVIGALNPKAGCAGSVVDLLRMP